MRELIIKKCPKCNALIKVIKDCTCDNCGINCCGKSMITLKANSVDAAFEKHVPTYERKNNKLIITVNHVMEEEHFIKWVCLVTDEKEEYRYFKTNDTCTCEFDDVNNGTLYSYCNKHGLWSNNI